ncbi:MAG: hypothetical protein WBG50_04765 [Desulfomonilaceae bacterium]
MRYTAIMLSIGLATAAIVALSVGPSYAQSTTGTPAFLASAAIGGSAIGTAAAGPFMLAFARHGGAFRGGFYRGGRFGRGFYGGFYGYPGYSYYGGYPEYYDTTPSQSCVWNGYSYTCYNF